jgi:hypothetical protein
VSLKQPPAVFVYLSCSHTKRAAVGAQLALGQIAKARSTTELEPAMRLWQQAVSEVTDSKRVRAIDLYGGGVWRDLRTHEPTLRKIGVQVRIVSAGLGLLSPDDRIPSYNVTFTPGGPNSIGGGRGAVERNRQWWQLLGQWRHGFQGPRSLHATVKRHADAVHVIALPLDYLDSVLEDVNGIMEDDECRKRTVVLATPYSFFSRRIPGALDVPGDLYAALGGTRGTVLARTGLFLAEKLKERVTDRAEVARALAPLLTKTKPLPVRRAQTDWEVLKFLRNALQKNATAGHTTLLRSYRLNGYACEYTRFRKLHAEAKAAI